MNENEPRRSPVSSYSFAKRLTAIGFIGVILFGNLWLSYFLFTLEPAWFIQVGFYLSAAMAAVGGVLSVIDWIALRLSRGVDSEDE